MTRDWLSADDIIHMLNVMVFDHGEQAFTHNGHAHLYSGPSDAVWKQILSGNQKNHERAIKWARDHGAVLIEDTVIGQFLDKFEGMGTFEYFDINPNVQEDASFDEAIKPWQHASRLYGASLWGNVTTTSCGAYRKGVYYTIELVVALTPDPHGEIVSHEMRALLNPDNKKIETINGIAMDCVERVCRDGGIEAAHRRINLGEQREALYEAMRTASATDVRVALRLTSAEVLKTSVEAYRYFLASQERYRIDRALQSERTSVAARPVYAQTPEERQQRRDEQVQEFATHVLAALDAKLAEKSAPTRPLSGVRRYIVTHKTL